MESSIDFSATRGNPMPTRSLWMTGLFIQVLISPTLSQSDTLFGPQKFERKKGQPAAEVPSFAPPSPGPGFAVTLINGNDDGKHRLSTAPPSPSTERFFSAHPISTLRSPCSPQRSNSKRKIPFKEGQGPPFMSLFLEKFLAYFQGGKF